MGLGGGLSLGPGEGFHPPPHGPPLGRASVDLSVVIPTHNAATNLEQQVHALLDQETTAQYEVIIVDNGSTDDTARVAERLVHSDPRVRYVPATDRAGAAYARNVGTAAARANSIAYCDSDDEVA